MIDCLNHYPYVFKLIIIIMWIVLLLNPIFYIAAANKICNRAIPEDDHFLCHCKVKSII